MQLLPESLLVMRRHISPTLHVCSFIINLQHSCFWLFFLMSHALLFGCCKDDSPTRLGLCSRVKTWLFMWRRRSWRTRPYQRTKASGPSRKSSALLEKVRRSLTCSFSASSGSGFDGDVFLLCRSWWHLQLRGLHHLPRRGWDSALCLVALPGLLPLDVRTLSTLLLFLHEITSPFVWFPRRRASRQSWPSTLALWASSPHLNSIPTRPRSHRSLKVRMEDEGKTFPTLQSSHCFLQFLCTKESFVPARRQRRHRAAQPLESASDEGQHGEEGTGGWEGHHPDQRRRREQLEGCTVPGDDSQKPASTIYDNAALLLLAAQTEVQIKSSHSFRRAGGTSRKVLACQTPTG